jgi:hypothetical protein
MYAPEHLIVNVEDAEAWLPALDNAGARREAGVSQWHSGYLGRSSMVALCLVAHGTCEPAQRTRRSPQARLGSVGGGWTGPGHV